jgi:hypothetical protein
MAVGPRTAGHPTQVGSVGPPLVSRRVGPQAPRLVLCSGCPQIQRGRATHEIRVRAENGACRTRQNRGRRIHLPSRSRDLRPKNSLEARPARGGSPIGRATRAGQCSGRRGGHPNRDGRRSPPAGRVPARPPPAPPPRRAVDPGRRRSSQAGLPPGSSPPPAYGESSPSPCPPRAPRTSRGLATRHARAHPELRRGRHPGGLPRRDCPGQQTPHHGTGDRRDHTGRSRRTERNRQKQGTDHAQDRTRWSGALTRLTTRCGPPLPSCAYPSAFACRRASARQCSGSWVRLVVARLEVLEGEVGVDLCRR